MKRSGRDAPLPRAMQGRWSDVDDAASELVVQGGDITCFGQPVDYDCKLMNVVDGTLTVSRKIEDRSGEDSFQRSNITELVITPEGEFYAYNLKFGTQFERVGARPKRS